jgi:hypothetical protein
VDDLQLDEVLARTRIPDAGVREVLNAQAELPRRVRRRAPADPMWSPKLNAVENRLRPDR